ncbi:6,7-dimethyl-8-ribityllumazine synthase [candidate division KSB1 bacterium]|nr:MAG: 6,7-dimethyl-8-ribityllumazine synthase [candidate division KSB1 bacterium]
MTTQHKGSYSAKDKKIGIVVSKFNEFISNKLLDGCIDCLLRHQGDEKNIEVFWVPGSFEIPAVAIKLAENNKFDGVICLGVLIRGDTPHFNYIASEVTKGIAQVGLKTGKPVIYGIITADTMEQAIERAGTKAGNKGWNSAMALMEMIDLFRKIEE